MTITYNRTLYNVITEKNANLLMKIDQHYLILIKNIFVIPILMIFWIVSKEIIKIIF